MSAWGEASSSSLIPSSSVVVPSSPGAAGTATAPYALPLRVRDRRMVMLVGSPLWRGANRKSHNPHCDQSTPKGS